MLAAMFPYIHMVHVYKHDLSDVLLTWLRGRKGKHIEKALVAKPGVLVSSKAAQPAKSLRAPGAWRGATVSPVILGEIKCV